jgi:hypothetical protein
MQRTVEDEPEPREPRDPGVLRQVWARIVGQVSDAGTLIDEVTRKGIRFLRSSIGRLPLFTSTWADVGDRSLEVDESHYFLVPYRKSACGYALYAVRALPPGVGPSNDLPKARIFHLHHPGAVAVLEGLIIEERKERALTAERGGSDLAESLERLGDDIDRESSKASCGLLIVGGVVALINPLVGAGIAANSLVPALGAKASKLGLHYAGRKIRSRAEALRARRAVRSAKAEVRKLKPRILVNPLLVLLEEAVSTLDPGHEPLLSTKASVNEFASVRHLRVSIQAVLAVYDEAMRERSAFESWGLHEADRLWLRHLRDLSATIGGYR